MPITRLGSCVHCGSPRGATIYYCTRTSVDWNPEAEKEFAKIVCSQCVKRHMLTYGAISLCSFLLTAIAVVFAAALVIKGEPVISWITVGLIGVLFAVAGFVLIWRHCVYAGSSIVIHHLQKDDGHPSPYRYLLGKSKVVVITPSENEWTASSNGGNPETSR